MSDQSRKLLIAYKGQVRSHIADLIQLCLGDERLAGEEVFEHDAPEDRLELREAGAGRRRREQGDYARAEHHQHCGQRRPGDWRQGMASIFNVSQKYSAFRLFRQWTLKKGILQDLYFVTI